MNEEPQTLPAITCAGDPWNLGCSYGQQAREAIRQNIEVESVDDDDRWEPYLDMMRTRLGKDLPDLLAELEGLAEGADVPLAAILRLNLNPCWNQWQGCTPLAVAAGPDGPILAKNNDGMPPQCDRRSFLVRHIQPSQGLAQTQITDAGRINGLDGVNQAGLGMMHASVGSKLPRPDDALDIRLWAYCILQQARSVEDALMRFGQRPLMGKGFNVVLADRHGQTAVLEAAVPVLAVRARNEPFVFATNHYIHSQLASHDCRSEYNRECSVYRYGYLRGVQQTAPPSSLEDVHRLMKTSGGWAPFRTGQPDGWKTLWSVVIPLQCEPVISTTALD